MWVSRSWNVEFHIQPFNGSKVQDQKAELGRKISGTIVWKLDSLSTEPEHYLDSG
jgi:hypothetical protein